MEFQVVSELPARSGHKSGKYAAILNAASEVPGSWFLVQDENLTPKQIPSLQQGLRKAYGPLLETAARTGLLYVRVPEVVSEVAEETPKPSKKA